MTETVPNTLATIMYIILIEIKRNQCTSDMLLYEVLAGMLDYLCAADSFTHQAVNNSNKFYGKI